MQIISRYINNHAVFSNSCGSFTKQNLILGENSKSKRRNSNNAAASENHISTREIAMMHSQVGISVLALIEKGFVKLKDFDKKTKAIIYELRHGAFV